jgi:hypothetical protein
MPFKAYTKKKFSQQSQAMIAHANAIIADYQRQGFDLTLRQLYYQFVARDLIPNSLRDYKNLGNLINDARLAGHIDWEAITDRTRNLEQNQHWQNPGDIIRAAARSFRHDLWRTQDTRVETWIEKDALKGLIEGVCRELDTPFFSCRGYTSQSEMWAAAQRLITWERLGQNTVILHLGDHDPSGQDMTRDIRERLERFGAKTEVQRIALTMAQIETYRPPPNPAKVTDSRAEAYIKKFGGDSWELHALEPRVLVSLVRDHLETYIDEEKWRDAIKQMQAHVGILNKVARGWRSL